MRFIVALLVLALARNAAGQRIPGDTLSSAECQIAADSLAAASRDLGSWQALLSCPSHVSAALTSAIAAAKSETDTTYLGGLLTLGGSVQTSAVFNASLAVSTDKTASLAARITGLGTLVSHIDNSFTIRRLGIGWAQLLTVPRGQNCKLASGAEGNYVVSGSMPADYLRQIAIATDQIRNDVTESAVVRDLAGCIRNTLLNDVPEIVDPGLITFTYICATRFKVHNGNASWAGLSYAVEGTAETGDFDAKPSGDTFIVTLAKGATKLRYGSQLIATATSTGARCTP